MEGGQATSSGAPCLSLCQVVAEEKLLARERRLQGLEAEAESLRQKHQQEILEYQEQVKQHARTIVELEERLVSAAQQAEEGRGVSRPRGQCSMRSLPRPPPYPPELARGRRGPPGFLWTPFAPKLLAAGPTFRLLPLPLFPPPEPPRGGRGPRAARW